MRIKLWVVTAIAGCSLLHASTIAFSSCSAGSTTVSPCGGSILFPGGIVTPNYSSTAFAAASDNSIVPGLAMAVPPLPSFSGQSMSAIAEAEVAGAPPLTLPLAALALASASSTFYTTGPNRPGFIQFNVQLDRLHGGSSDAQFSDGVHTYSYNVLGFGSTASLFCGPESCGWTAIVPFDLGVHFDARASASDSEFATPDVHGGGAHGNVDSMLTFRVLDANGAPVPFFVTPEPSSWALLLLGLGACAWRLRKRAAKSVS